MTALTLADLLAFAEEQANYWTGMMRYRSAKGIVTETDQRKFACATAIADRLREAVQRGERRQRRKAMWAHIEPFEPREDPRAKKVQP